MVVAKTPKMILDSLSQKLNSLVNNGDCLGSMDEICGLAGQIASECSDDERASQAIVDAARTLAENLDPGIKLSALDLLSSAAAKTAPKSPLDKGLESALPQLVRDLGPDFHEAAKAAVTAIANPNRPRNFTRVAARWVLEDKAPGIV